MARVLVRLPDNSLTDLTQRPDIAAMWDGDPPRKIVELPPDAEIAVMWSGEPPRMITAEQLASLLGDNRFWPDVALRTGQLGQ